MHIDRPELKKEAGRYEEEGDESKQSAKRYGQPIFREGKVFEDERAAVLDACGICPCVTVRTMVVAARKFIDGRRAKPVKLERIKVSIRSCGLDGLGSQSRKCISSIERISELFLPGQRSPNHMSAPWRTGSPLEPPTQNPSATQRRKARS